MTRVKKLTTLVVLAAALLSAAPGYSQGCVMCRTSAAAGGDEAMKAFDLAVLVLLIPTLLIFIGILVFAFRYRNHPRVDTTEGFPTLDHPARHRW
ncbi:MAG TPA: hypothetical protein VNN18_02490 [Candidatus Xenobia bacterium]|nr:hypothetical protein [Candidatus Xenobia bacterium]